MRRLDWRRLKGMKHPNLTISWVPCGTGFTIRFVLTHDVQRLASVDVTCSL